MNSWVVLEGLSVNRTEAAVQAREVGEKMLIDISQLYMLKEVEHYSTASIGISLFANYRQNLDDLLKQADTAMYAAKKAGRNTLRFFDPAMQAALEIRSQLEAGMRKALPRYEFKLYYQMQVDSEQRPIGAEALIRWEDPEQGMINPSLFIPVAEDTGLILPIGQWVLQTACEQLKEWESNPLTGELSLAVNVSARQFRQPGFVKQVSEMIKQTSINPSRLKIELTESTGARKCSRHHKQDACAEIDRRAFFHGRFWHGLLIAGISDAIAARSVEDRPVIRAQPRNKIDRFDDSSNHYRHGQQSRH